MTAKYLRIGALFERSDLVHIDGQWCVPMVGLGEVLAQGGLAIVEAKPEQSRPRERASGYRYVDCGCGLGVECPKGTWLRQ